MLEKIVCDERRGQYSVSTAGISTLKTNKIIFMIYEAF